MCFANSVIGARSNREGGPSALASALTGRTPAYGMPLDERRSPSVTIEVVDGPPTAQGTVWFGALGKAIGERLQALGGQPVPYIRGVAVASLEELKSFCASLATYGGAALFHLEGITPEAARYTPPKATIAIEPGDLGAATRALNDASLEEVDFVSLGCPHLSIREIARLAELLGTVSGAVAGLVAITPAAGYVSPLSAVVIGIGAGGLCYMVVNYVMLILGYDDSLDVFGMHGVGGLWGMIATGLLASIEINPDGSDGLFFGYPYQFFIQVVGAVFAAAFAGAMSLLLMKGLSLVLSPRVESSAEAMGLDLTQHGEKGYS